MSGRTIEVAGLAEGERFGCYLSEPEGRAPKAAVIVIQEVFGVNAGIRAKCDHWTSLGYLALAPDLFWRGEPGFEVDPDADGALDRGIAQMQALDQDKAIGDIEATIRRARALAGGGRVGAVGYCLGGRLVFLTATRTDVDASVGYYGVGIDQLSGEAHAIARPLMLHVPTADGFVPPAAQAAMHAALDPHPRVVIHDYPGLDHGFATSFGSRRDDAAAKQADARTEAFFAEHLARS